MRNADRKPTEQLVDVYLALRRKKDNPELKDLCFREVDNYGDGQALEKLKTRIKNELGVWRIHKTINKRDTHKALKLLQHRMIDNFEDVAHRLDSIWKTCLLQKESKAERNVLLDIDSEEAFQFCTSACWELDIDPILWTQTPNGNHIILEEGVDTRPFMDIKDVTLQRDGYAFVELVYGRLRSVLNE